MAKQAAHPAAIVDEQWMREWLDFGYAELGRYLAKRAAFADYCERRDNPPRKRPKRKERP